MRKLLLTAVILFSTFLITAQVPYSRVKLSAGQEEMTIMASHGLMIDHGIVKDGIYVICELSAEELDVVRACGISYEVLIPDVSKFYEERNAPYLHRLAQLKRQEYTLSREWPVPQGFELGPVGGFLTIDQTMDHLDAMAALYPNLISPRSELNYTSHNGRDVYWVRISDNPGVKQDKPEILYTGMIHAREAIGMQLLIFYMYYLLENYETDPDVQYIVDNFELYFVPIVNPDGYAFNIQNNPNGGGMWRKNRRPNDDGSHGVDLNRNFGYMWGINNSGSSPDPPSETYRGPYAFSEPETQCLEDFCEDYNFIIALNYHSYSNLLLYPWGYTSQPCPHDEIFNAHAAIMTKENGYTYGPGNTTIYATNGGSDDYMYGEQTTKNMIYSYTPEVGDGNAGFWPPISQIIPLCQENMWQNMMAAKLAGPYATVTDLASTILENTSGLLFFQLQRLGLQDSVTYTVSIEPLNDAIDSVSAPLTFSNLDILETTNGAFSYHLREGIENGTEVLYLLTIDDGLGSFSDTIRKIYGTPVVIFEDDAETFDKWISVKWNVTNLHYVSPERSIADSPYGQYSNYENNVIVLKDPIDLGDAVYAELNFWARWDIEAGYDYVQVFISGDNGGTWTPMQGKYTRPGNSNQASGQPLYDGTQTTWVREEISLEPYLGGSVKIRFVLRSDSYVVADGFYWDDMTVTIVDTYTSIPEGDRPEEQTRFTIMPNPSSGEVNLVYSPEDLKGNTRLTVYDASGQLVYETRLSAGSGKTNWSVSEWPSGMYFYLLHDENARIASGKLIVE